MGKINLPVPLYSAIKKQGKPLYWYARQGKEVELPIKEMEIRSIKLLETKYEDSKLILTILIGVGSGAYIRSIAEEIGNRLGYPATIQNLRRTTIGDFKIEDAEKI